MAIPTLRDYMREGMPYFKLKGKILVKRSEFDEWLESFRADTDCHLRSLVDSAIESLNN